MYRVVWLALFLSGAVGQVIKDGVCNYGAIGGFVTDVNLTEMFGAWNQVARINNDIETGECNGLAIEGAYDNTTLIGTHAYYSEVINKTTYFHNGTVEQFPLVNGLFYMNLTGFFEGTFVILSTNYTDYAILYHCHTLTTANEAANTTDTKYVIAWQFHRKAELTSSEQESILAIIDQNPELNGTSWRYISHNNTACGRNAAVSLAIPRVLVIVAALFIGKGFF